MLGNTIFDSLDLNSAVLGIFKIFFVIASLLYIIFAIVVVRQISVMKKTLITSFSPVITVLGFIHLIFAIVMSLFYLVIL